MRFESWLPVELAERAVSFEDAHVADVGFSPSDALAVVTHLAKAELGVLGADLWQETPDGHHKPAHVALTVKIVRDETWQAFVRRSGDEAADAVRRFAALPTEGRWLVAVTSVKRGDWELDRVRRKDD